MIYVLFILIITTVGLIYAPGITIVGLIFAILMAIYEHRSGQ